MTAHEAAGAAGSAAGSAAGASYIRAGGGVEIRRRLVLQLLAGIAAVALAGSAVALAASAAVQNSQRQKLAHHGVAVTATVTGCVALGSGVGEAIIGYTCNGRYTLDGRTFVAVIHGPDFDRPVGSAVASVAVPGSPSLLTAVGSVPPPRGWWASYLVTVILSAAAVLVAIGTVGVSRRTGRAGDTGETAGGARPKG